MKISVCGLFGAAGVFSYTLAILIKGSPEMSSYGTVASREQKVLDDAKEKYNAAKTAYQDVQDRINRAKSTIVDANCYISKYSSFESSLSAYCANASQVGNSLTILNQYYGITVVSMPDKTTYSFRTGSYLDCYDVPDGQTCTTVNGVTNCTPKTKRKCDTIYYTIPQTTYEYHGATLQGSGSQTIMPCGMFTQAIAISASQYYSDTGMQTDDYSITYLKVLSEKRTIIYDSKVVIPINADSATITSTATYTIDRTTNNFAAAAAAILSRIAQQCNQLQSSLKSPAHYQEIVNTTTESLPGLNYDASIKQSLLNNATAYRDAIQKRFDAADSDYQASLALWLLQLFLAVPACIALLYFIEQEFKRREYQSVPNFDTEKPCKPFAWCYERRKLNRTSAPSNNFEGGNFEAEMSTVENPPNARIITDPSERTLKTAKFALTVE